MSRAEVTKAAPCFSRLLVPAERGSSGLPGTAKSLGKGRRIAWLADGDEMGAECFCRGQLSFRLVRRMSWTRPPRRDSIGKASMVASRRQIR
jgi:hypothetical protein